MLIKFLGAIHGVTGSCTWLKHKKTEVEFLIDCGMVQGTGDADRLNSKAFEFNPKQIKYLFLTHSHLDHCGLIPRLYNEGFKGEVLCSKATSELTKIILKDSAKNSELFSEKDVDKIKFRILDTGNSEFKFGKSIKLEQDLLYSFQRSSHILGSLSYNFLWKDSKDKDRSIFFSGDIGGNSDLINCDILLKKHHIPYPNCEFMVLESTYGANTKKRYPHNEKIEFLKKSLKLFFNDPQLDTLIIPSFSQHRYQQIIVDIYNIVSSMKNENFGFDFKFNQNKGIKLRYFIKDFFKNDSIPESQKEYVKNNIQLVADKDIENYKEGIDYSFQEFSDNDWSNKVISSMYVTFNRGNQELKTILEKYIGVKVDVLFDSKLGNKINNIYYQNLDDKKRSKDGIDNKFISDELQKTLNIDELKEIFLTKENRVSVGNFNFADKLKDSSDKKKIIITSSGMCSNGKIVEHLENYLEQDTCMMWLTGYQAEKTVGHTLQNLLNDKYDSFAKELIEIPLKTKSIKLNRVKMKLENISKVYSGHIFADELISDYIFNDYKSYSKEIDKEINTTLFLNHGSSEAKSVLKEKISEFMSSNKTIRKLENIFIPDSENKVFDLEYKKWTKSGETKISEKNMKDFVFNALTECLNSKDENIKLKAIELALKYNL